MTATNHDRAMVRIALARHDAAVARRLARERAARLAVLVLIPLALVAGLHWAMG